VLVVGGYAILEQPNAGLVLATSARFRTTVSVEKRSAWPAHNAVDERELPVRVISPQFNQDLVYAVTEEDAASDQPEHAVRVHELRTDQPSNSYVRDTLAVAMAAIVGLKQQAPPTGQTSETMTLASLARICQEMDLGVSVLLQADNDFYSQVGRLQSNGLPLTRASLSTLPPFVPCLAGEDGSVAKTGLGSSAAMITSFSAALLCFMRRVSVDAREPRLADSHVALVHEVAQVCHAAAQGKIGSGFDVMAAVYGSAEYVRYSTTVLAPLLVSKDAKDAKERESRYSCESVMQCLGADAAASANADADAKQQLKWDYTANSFGLPRGIDMACADINGGSESPSMSRTVSHTS
jgi:phosphomevalonate kinase